MYTCVCTLNPLNHMIHHLEHLDSHLSLLHLTTKVNIRLSISLFWGKALSSRATAIKDMPRRPSWHKCYEKWGKSRRYPCRTDIDVCWE